MIKHFIRKVFLGLILASLFSACTGLAVREVTPKPARATKIAVHSDRTPTPTERAVVTATASQTSTNTAIFPTPTQTATPQPLTIFKPRMAAGVEPVAYLESTCDYLRKRWDQNNAQPGTVVVPVMYHGVRREGGTVSDNITVTQKYFEESLAYAKRLGFQTITIDQMVNFLHHNAYIPPRSLLLIIDDRRLGTVRNHFLPLLEKNNWTLVMAYITGIINEREWHEIKEVLASGRVEIEPHGYKHSGETYFTERTADEIVIQEIYAPINAFEENLGYHPRAFIWPGGNFTTKSVTEVERAGYLLGFTAYARGPVMFNWVPQGEPERLQGKPLLLLPRYWSTALFINLDQTVEMAASAAEYAEQNKELELAWYAANCAGFPPIRGILPEEGKRKDE